MDEFLVRVVCSWSGCYTGDGGCGLRGMMAKMRKMRKMHMLSTFFFIVLECTLAYMGAVFSRARRRFLFDRPPLHHVLWDEGGR